MAPRSVRCRSGRPSLPDDRTASRCSSRLRRAAGDRTLVRAAASSIASGKPSRRVTIAAIVRSSSSVGSKPGRAIRARSTNSATAPISRRTAGGARSARSGRWSGGTGIRCSPYRRSGRRLVTSTLILGAAFSRPSMSGAASRICSRLSRTSSSERTRRCSVSASVGVRSARLGHTERRRHQRGHEGGLTDQVERNETDAVAEAGFEPFRDPDRQTVSCRSRPGRSGSPADAPRRAATTSSSCPSRPTNVVNGSGRVRRPASSERIGGKSAGSPSITKLVQVLLAVQVLEPVVPDVPEVDAVARQAASGQGLGLLGDQDLAAVRGRGDPGGPVDIEPDVVRRRHAARRRCGARSGPGGPRPRATARPRDRAGRRRPRGWPRPASRRPRRTSRPRCPPRPPSPAAMADRTISACRSRTAG